MLSIATSPIELYEYCEEQKAIFPCMVSHASHPLQPLDVYCFASLKRAYYIDMDSWSLYARSQIKKESFLPAFRTTFDNAIAKNNILASFRCATLVRHDPERVLPKLEVVLRADSIITSHPIAPAKKLRQFLLI